MVKDSGAPPPALKDLRARLDETDAEIVRLVAQRLQTVDLIIREKSGHASGIRDPERERQVLAKVEGHAQALGISGPLARKIFSEIVAHSVNRQAATLSGPGGRELRVAYQGSPLTYHHLAAQKYVAGLGTSGTFFGTPTIKEATDQLATGSVDLALLSIENTAAGSSNEVYDVLRTRDFTIVGEETYQVSLCLAGPAEIPLPAIQRVHSHPLALDQSSVFLAALPHAVPIPCVDTAEALKLVAAAQDPTWVAIGSPEGADAHGLAVLRRGIGNHDEILMRYVALARQPESFDARIPCKVSLILSTRHEQGALVGCLAVLADHRLSLTKVESRPHPNRPWEYMFFIDFEGNVADPRVAAALDELRARALFLKILGCYPVKARAAEVQASNVQPTVAAQPALTTTAAAPLATTPARANARAPRRSSSTKLADRTARAEDTLVRIGDLLIGGTGFAVMAGPALVDTKEQIEAAARFVKARGVHLLRGSVARPGTGGWAEQALDLLVAAGKATGLPVVTEVVTAEQVHAIAGRVDLLHVGAQNMQNAQLLQAVGKIDRPVLLERGVSSTIDEWLAAAEQILAAGNGQVILCERGIRTFETATHNTLDLSSVVVLKERTHLPIVVDPGHATGHHAYVAPLAWAARACGANGILVEIHAEPASDASPAGAHADEQGLSFAEFDLLMAGLARAPT